MLFVTPVSRKGKFNKRALNDLEQYLIGLAYQANEELQNIQGIPKPSFEIVGIQTAKNGPRGSALQAFRKTFKPAH
jgi:hypothetical protein